MGLAFAVATTTDTPALSTSGRPRMVRTSGRLDRSGGRGAFPIPRRVLGAFGAVEVVEDAAGSGGHRGRGGAEDVGVPADQAAT
jgi:hypothetical protein